MFTEKLYRIIKIALPVCGSAIFIFSCSGKTTPEPEEYSNIMTGQAENLVGIESKMGSKARKYMAPLMEEYADAREPYREYRRGVYAETYSNDSVPIVESTIEADYAIQFIDKELWELKGNVKATNSKGQIMETQQLFWNQKTEKIYSNIDTKVTQGDDVLYGTGFESDQDFEVWEVRRPRGKLAVDIEPTEPNDNEPEDGSDSTASGPVAGSSASNSNVSGNDQNSVILTADGPGSSQRESMRDRRRRMTGQAGGDPTISEETGERLPEEETPAE